MYAKCVVSSDKRPRMTQLTDEARIDQLLQLPREALAGVLRCLLKDAQRGRVTREGMRKMLAAHSERLENLTNKLDAVLAEVQAIKDELGCLYDALELYSQEELSRHD